MTGELLLLPQARGSSASRARVEPPGPRHDGIEAGVVEGGQDPVVRDVRLLPGAGRSSRSVPGGRYGRWGRKGSRPGAVG